MLIAVNYHYIRWEYNEPYAGIHGVTPEEFERQLRLLGSIGQFVGAEEIVAALEGRRRLPERAIVVTLDDGLREQYEQAWPILCRLGIPAIFFVSTAAVAERRVLGVHKTHLVRSRMAPAEVMARLTGQPDGALPGQVMSEATRRMAGEHYNYDEPETACLKYALNFLIAPELRDRLIGECFEELHPGGEAEVSESLYLSTEEMRILAEAGCLGSHADDHLPLGLLSPTEARAEIARSLDRLESWTGRRPWSLSYPFGSQEACAPHVAESAAALGLRFAFTVERAGNADLRAPLHLARCDCNDLPGGKAARWEAGDLFERIPAREWYRDLPGGRLSETEARAGAI